MESIGLDDFLQKHFGIALSALALPDPNASLGVDAISRSRSKEESLRSFLPLGLVRRLDAGFARSNTVHPDTARALYTLCFATPTQDVFETGTYWGYSTTYLAAALQDKDAGKVYSFDIYDQAGKHIPDSLHSHVELHRGRPSIETMPEVLQRVTPGLFFQDSRHDYEGVHEELTLMRPHLPTNAIILMHDFVHQDVQKAAEDVLQDYTIYILQTEDPQQLGVAVKTAPT